MTTRAVTYWISAATVAAIIGTAALAGATHDAITGTGSLAEALPGQTPINPNITIPGRTTTTGSGTATATQQTGIVTVVSVLKYQQAESAGTGMILTSDGEILTNNHVIDGATSTKVTVQSTGQTYRADVVGTDPSDDVAVLQVRNVSGLTTAKVGDSSGISVGDAVVGVGNAGGTGRLTAASGSITALGKSITASDDGANAERLTGLIEIDAQIISGDSGGPLYDSAGQIIGMDTAASANRVQASAYAIPIDRATQIAAEIERGVETTSIHIGYPGFLGIGTATANVGVGVANVLPGGPAARAGITQGAAIIRVGGKAVHNGDALRSLLATYDPGTTVRVIWDDPGAQRHVSNITLATGPAD
jgi:S1-C subfamily serine protease